MKRVSVYCLALVIFSAACAYRPWAGELRPLEEGKQAEGMVVADDGTVTFKQGRLEVRLRPMTDEELNRQFSAYSDKGPRSENPYTFANTTYFRTKAPPQRFTVFRLTVKNYEYPKVRLAGIAHMESSNGRKYYGLNLDQLDVYYRTYAIGYRGQEYNEYKERRALLKRTMFPQADDIFSGQEAEGYILFEPLANDVSEVEVTIPDLITRFDFRGDPVENMAITYRFQRDLGRYYPAEDRIEPIASQN